MTSGTVTSATVTSATTDPSVTRLTWRVMRKRTGTFVRGGTGWDLYFIGALGLGLLLELIFDGIVDDRSATYLTVTIGAYAGVELARRLVVHGAALTWVRVWTMAEMHLRGGMLRGQVSSGGRDAGPQVTHTGAAMARFRDDPTDVAWYLDVWVDIVGAGIYAIVSITIMAMIDPWLTLVAVLPIFAIAATTRLLGGWVTTAHRRHLEAASSLTATLRDVFAAQDTIRLYRARNDVIDEVARRSRRRSDAAIVDRVLTDSVRAASNSLAGISIGLVLLLAADDLRSGDLSIGELALFITYLRYMTFFPRMLGHFLTRHRQTRVAFDRMGELGAGGRAASLLDQLDLDIDRSPEPTIQPTPDRIPLRRLEVTGLTAAFEGETVVDRADFALDGGTLTVLCGAVGAGKTTLVRSVLGLVPSEGEVRWNDRVIDDLAGFMTPPNAAYLPQTPRLFSDTLADNIELGADGLGVDHSLAAAGLAEEVARMHAGTATIVGPRGVRLSGGQRQRLALARALHRQPELLVLDDLSSAVDADTELALWEAMRRSGVTILAISNRPIAIAAADQVLTLRGGRLHRTR